MKCSSGKFLIYMELDCSVILIEWYAKKGEGERNPASLRLRRDKKAKRKKASGFVPVELCRDGSPG